MIMNNFFDDVFVLNDCPACHIPLSHPLTNSGVLYCGHNYHEKSKCPIEFRYIINNYVVFSTNLYYAFIDIINNYIIISDTLTHIKHYVAEKINILDFRMFNLEDLRSPESINNKINLLLTFK